MGSKYTAAQNKATQKYISKAYDTITVRPSKGTKDRWKAEADNREQSLSQFIIDCVEGEIARSSNPQPDSPRQTVIDGQAETYKGQE